MTDQWEEIPEQIKTGEEPAEETAEQTPEEQVSPEQPDSEAEKKETLLASAYDMLSNLVTAFILVTVVLCFCFRLVDVDGTSMLNTLQDKDRLILRTAFYTPARGDIVVVYRDNRPEEPLIKRVIAVGGDTLRLEPDPGMDRSKDRVLLKKAGESEFTVLEEPYVQYPLKNTPYEVDWERRDIPVPEGYVFVMGDHRNNSSDSRGRVDVDPDGVMLSDGCFPVEDVVGKAVFRMMPFSSFGAL